VADASKDAEAARPKFEAYAKERGLLYFDNWSMPQPTQLLQHGFTEEVPNLVMGDLPGGLKDGWLAHFDYKTIGRKIEDHPFTVVVARAAASVAFAQRVLCHDRDLSKLEAEDPGEGLEILERDDRAVQVESDALLERYAIWVGHDQDPVRTWQLFDPALIDWLTRQAPPDFSFELQNGALSCFVPGVIADAAALDALCHAAERILSRLGEMAPAAAAADTTAAEIEEKLAKHPFERPPRSVHAAALHFGPVPLVSHSSWQLGSEAFFRSHAAALGLERVEPADFLASHIDTVIPGSPTQVARGTLPGTQLEGWLLWTTEVDQRGVTWEVVLAEIATEDNGYAFTRLDAADKAEKDGFEIVSDGNSISIFKATNNPHTRDAKELHAFIERACPLLEQCVKAAKQR
jgi:hypothetical protein